MTSFLVAIKSIHVSMLQAIQSPHISGANLAAIASMMTFSTVTFLLVVSGLIVSLGGVGLYWLAQFLRG